MIGTDILKAQTFLENKDVIGFPTETVYGIAGNAYHIPTLKKIFAIKNRPYSMPLTLQIGSIDKVSSLVKYFPPKARQLAAAFWPGPLTLLLEKKPHIPDLTTAGLPTVGIRIPKHPIALKLLQKLPFPLAVPSANPCGYISPTSAQHVKDQLGSKIPYILDGGTCSLGIESTIIGFKADIPTLYRLGYIGSEEIKKVIGTIRQTDIIQLSSSPTTHPRSTQTKHYTLHTPLIVGHLPTLLKKYRDRQVAIMAFDTPVQGIATTHQVVLSRKADLEEAGQRFFSALQYLDSLGATLILASELPQQGLGKVINDRLQKASNRIR